MSILKELRRRNIILYRAGKGGGARSAANFREQFEFSSVKQSIAVLCSALCCVVFSVVL